MCSIKIHMSIACVVDNINTCDWNHILVENNLCEVVFIHLEKKYNC